MRWEDLIVQRGSDAQQFALQFLHDPQRSIMIVGGAGFDPRATHVTKLITTDSKATVQSVYFREERPSPSSRLSERADQNISELKRFVPSATFHQLDIFATDGAAIGGRKAIELLNAISLQGVTDIAVDISALSPGIYYPVIRFYRDRLKDSAQTNLHLFVVSHPSLDEKITRVSDDKASFVHGFKGTLALDESKKAAKLWLPQLTSGSTAQLRTLYAFLQVEDVCPILPFPSHDPQISDRLVWEHRELLGSWEVDFRNVVFAAEDDPRDLYFSICRIVEKRQMVFRELGGSVVCLSPLGSKLLSVGGLLAAMEFNLPVAYVEANSYDLDEDEGCPDDGDIVHIWLLGEAYQSVS
jgi:hypothetical protein